MSTYFKELKFSKEIEGTKFLKRSTWRAFIPGINSGVYRPASICLMVRIEEWKNKFWRFRKTVSNADITLNQKEFDALYEEMTKIKNLRDNENTRPK